MNTIPSGLRYRPELWRIAWIVLVTAAVFVPALTFYFISDDFQLIEIARRTPLSRLFTEETYVYYRPLLMLSLKLEHALWGASPLGYHAANIALHIVNTALFCLIAHRILPAGNPWILSGLLFGITPIHASSVLWICGRTDLLCATFCLLSVLTFLISLQGNRRTAMQAISLVALAGALLCKEMAVSLPLVCLAWSLLILKTGRGLGSAVLNAAKASWGHFFVLAAYLLLRYLLFGHIPRSPVHSNWAPGVILTNLARYAVGLSFPLGLEETKPFFRAHPRLLFVGAIAILGVLLILAQRISKDRTLRLSAAWIGITLLPVARLYAPWYLYIPSAGVALALGYLLHLAILQTADIRLRRGFIGLVIGLHLLGLAHITYRTSTAGRISRQIMSALTRMPTGRPVVLAGLPSEYRGVPVFGWPGNLSYALRLLNHPIPVSALSSIRYTDLDAPVAIVVNRKENRVTIDLRGSRNFFRLHNIQVVTGSASPREGHTYDIPGARMQVVALNEGGLPTTLSVTPTAVSLSDTSIPVLVYAKDRLQSADGRSGTPPERH